MKGKVVSRITVTLLLANILVFAFNVKSAMGQTYYYNFKIEVIPEYPTVNDVIEVKISFDKAGSFPDTFSPLSRVGNQFFVEITIYIPETWFPMIMPREETYDLGKLPAGAYSFDVTVTITGWGLGEYHHSKSFSVTSLSPVPEFPLGVEAAAAIALMVAVAYIWLKKRVRAKIEH